MGMWKKIAWSRPKTYKTPREREGAFYQRTFPEKKVLRGSDAEKDHRERKAAFRARHAARHARRQEA